MTGTVESETTMRRKKLKSYRSADLVIDSLESDYRDLEEVRSHLYANYQTQSNLAQTLKIAN